eukprot:scaffold3768_cov376-Prasinococcus_capsulatus_cf.AAC.30
MGRALSPGTGPPKAPYEGVEEGRARAMCASSPAPRLAGAPAPPARTPTPCAVRLLARGGRNGGVGPCARSAAASVHPSIRALIRRRLRACGARLP